MSLALLSPLATDTVRKLSIHPIVTEHSAEVLERWESPDGEPIAITPVRVATRGVFIAALVLFEDCTADKRGNCNVEMNIRAIAPDGSTYGLVTDVELWKDKKAPDNGMSQLGHDYMGIRIEPKDMPGKYTILVTARDRVSGNAAQAETAFEVE